MVRSAAERSVHYSLRICSLVSIQFTNVTDRRADISRRHRSEKNAVFRPISRRSCLSYNRYSSVRYERHNINAIELQLHYSVTSNNTKLVHWPLMGWLLHLVGYSEEGPGRPPEAESFLALRRATHRAYLYLLQYFQQSIIIR